MPEQQTQAVAPSTQSAVVCRLRHRVGRWGPSATAGEVELENVSAGAIEIEADMHPLQYLDLVVTNAQGATVSARPYGNIFSPREKPCILRLGPGEKYTHNVGLLGNVPEEVQTPGRYTVQAVYQYKGLRTISEPLQVDV